MNRTMRLSRNLIADFPHLEVTPDMEKFLDEIYEKIVNWLMQGSLKKETLETSVFLFGRKVKGPHLTRKIDVFIRPEMRDDARGGYKPPLLIKGGKGRLTFILPAADLWDQSLKNLLERINKPDYYEMLMHELTHALDPDLRTGLHYVMNPKKYPFFFKIPANEAEFFDYVTQPIELKAWATGLKAYVKQLKIYSDKSGENFTPQQVLDKIKTTRLGQSNFLYLLAKIPGQKLFKEYTKYMMRVIEEVFESKQSPSMEDLLKRAQTLRKEMKA